MLVVQGGPGTGKTAVALHRAAYLLYTHRERLARSGLLIVGPSPTFLRYIADVLPSLGETGVVLADLGSLRPGVEAHAAERPEVAEVKGRPRHGRRDRRRRADRQAVPGGAGGDHGRRDYAAVHPDGHRPCPHAAAGPPPGCTTRPGRRSRRRVVDRLPQKYADRLGADVRGGDSLLDAADLAALRREVAAEPSVHALIDRLWPRLTAERVVRDLFASRERLVAATPGWNDADRDLLLRPPSSPWTPADVPLLEEADELLGVDDSPSGPAPGATSSAAAATPRRPSTCCTARARRTPRPRRRPRSCPPSTCSTPRAWPPARRSATPGRRPSAPPPTARWTYGHVIVDEAQELSAMAWRLLLRRCPTRSMTLVGDVAQTGSLAGATSWAEVLTPHLGTHWRRRS